MSNTNYIVFPDYVYEGEIPLSPEIITSIKQDIKQAEEQQLVISTDFGWSTTAKTHLGDNLRKLQRLLGTRFIECLKPHVPTVESLGVQVIEPVIYNILPTLSILPKIETRRWYTGCLWMQTTNVGSHLQIESPAAKLLSTPKAIAPTCLIINPADFKYVFWPSHLSASFTHNKSMTNSIVFWFTFKSN